MNFTVKKVNFKKTIFNPLNFINFLTQINLMESNFECIACSTQFYVSRYIFHINNEKMVFYNMPSGIQIKCPHCCSYEVDAIKKVVDPSTIHYGTFSSASMEEKKNMLKKRADEHKKKTKEQYDEINRNFRGKAEEKYY